MIIQDFTLTTEHLPAHIVNGLKAGGVETMFQLINLIDENTYIINLLDGKFQGIGRTDLDTLANFYVKYNNNILEHCDDTCDHYDKCGRILNAKINHHKTHNQNLDKILKGASDHEMQAVTPNNNEIVNMPNAKCANKKWNEYIFYQKSINRATTYICNMGGM